MGEADRDDPNDGDEAGDESSEPTEPTNDSVESRLTRFFLSGSAAISDSADELLAGSAAEAGRMAHYLALNDVLEEGLDLLERQGGLLALEELSAGRAIGQYRLIREIGSGGMGVVYLAEDVELGRLVALKVMSRNTDKIGQRFQREAEITASLQHPNIVPVYGRGDVDGVQYIAMRYIAGVDVEKTLVTSRAEGRSTALDIFDHAARWCRDVAGALQHAHDSNIIHRDVKPSNILVEDDEPFVVDFGLATHEGDLALTQSGDIIGTVPYMSPEQIRGDVELVDHRCDIYSLGATLYQLLAGSPPFSGRSSQLIARQILTRDPPTLRRFGVPPDLEAVVFKAMEKSPERRYRSATELQEELESYLARRPVRARHLGPVRRGLRVLARHKLATAAAVAVVIGLATAGVLTLDANQRSLEATQQQRATDIERLGVARRAAESQRYGEAAEILVELVQRQPELAGEDFARYRKLANYDRAMELIFARRVYEEDEIRELLDEVGTLARGDDATGEDDWYQVLVRARIDRDFDAAIRAVDRWKARAGEETRGTRAARIFAAAGLGVDDDGISRIGETLVALPVHEPTDHFLAGLVLALAPGYESQALDELDAFLARRPKHYWGQFIKGNVLRYLGRVGESREVYTGLIALMSGDSGELPDDSKLRAAWFQRGLCHAELQQYPAALADYERSGEDQERALPRRLVSRASCRQGLGELAQARVLYRAALEHLDRFDAFGHERPAGRSPVFRRDERGVDYRSRILRQLIACELAEEGFDAADDLVDVLVQLDGEEASAEAIGIELEMFRISSESGLEISADYSPLAAEALELTEAYPESVHLQALVAELLRRSGRDARAMDTINELIARRPDSPLARFARAHMIFAMRIGFELAREDRSFSAEEMALLKPTLDRLEELTLVALDDLGSLDRNGVNELVVSGHSGRDEIRFLEAVLRYWRGELWTARVVFRSLLSSRELQRFDWSGMIPIFLGDACARLDRRREALDSYLIAFRSETPSGLALSRAGRLAASLGDVTVLRDVLQRMTSAPPSDWQPALELARPDYDSVRHLSSLSQFFDRG